MDRAGSERGGGGFGLDAELGGGAPRREPQVSCARAVRALGVGGRARTPQGLCCAQFVSQVGGPGAYSVAAPASEGCIHEHAQRLGGAAAELELPVSAPPPHEPKFSLVIMLDGWRVRQRGPDWGAGPRKKDPQRIAWHEIKSAVIYRLEQRAQSASGRGLLVEKYVVSTPPETSPLNPRAEGTRTDLGSICVIRVIRKAPSKLGGSC